MCYAHPSDDTESTPVSSIVVIPTYNERDNLTALTERLLALNLPLDILFIDDNSPDGTGKLADDLADSIPQVSVLHRERKLGYGTAVIEGFRLRALMTARTSATDRTSSEIARLYSSCEPAAVPLS